jgi:hypothetical protein
MMLDNIHKLLVCVNVHVTPCRRVLLEKLTVEIFVVFFLLGDYPEENYKYEPRRKFES